MNADDFTLKIHDSELEKWGVVPLHDNKLAQNFFKYVSACPCSIDFMGAHGLSVIFFYDRTEQPDKWKNHGGMCWKFDHETEASLYAIGISKQTIERGKQRTVETFLHECAHVLHGKDHRAHDDRFRDLLKVLIDEYNKANGTAYNCI